MFSPFTIPGAPPELLARINARRSRIPADMIMTLGAAEGGDGQEGGEQTQQQAAPPAPQSLGAPKPKAPPAEAADDGEKQTESEEARLRRENEALRRENAEKRVRARDAEESAKGQLTTALKALQEAGILPDSIKLDDADPVVVAQQAAEAARVENSELSARLVASEAELVVWRSGRELGVNAAALTDSRSFGELVKGLDPKADDFAAKVKEAARAAAEQNPSLKQAPGGSGRGGSQFAGGSGENSSRREYGSLSDAISADYQ